MSGGVAASPDESGVASVGVADGDAPSSGVGTGSLSVGVDMAVAMGDATLAFVAVASGGAMSSDVEVGSLAQPESRTIASAPMSDARSRAFHLARILKSDFNGLTALSECLKPWSWHEHG
jgi:hypothetical protein